MCFQLANFFAVILGVGGIFVPLTQKSKLLNKSRRKRSENSLGYISVFVKQLVIKSIILSYRKYSTLRYLTQESNFTYEGAWSSISRLEKILQYIY